MTILNDAVWRVLRTRLFDGVRPKLIRLNAYRLEGKTRFSVSFSTVVVGSKVSVEYFSKFLYVEEPRVEFLGKFSFDRVASSVDRAWADLTIVEGSWLFSRFLGEHGFFVSPRVDFVLDINGSMETIQNRATDGKRRRLRQVAGAGYSFEVTRDLGALESFYYDMYLPHMAKRHAGCSLPISFAECKELFLQGELLLVKSGEECISGNLLIPRGDELWEPVLGVKDVDKKLTLGSYAVYYFSIVVGVQRGFARMDFGEAPPFMQDGLFQFKKGLGMWVRPASGSGAQVFGVRFSGVGEGVRGFLSAFPFVFSDGGGLCGLVFLDCVDELSVRSFFVAGLGCLYVVSGCGGVGGLKGFGLVELSVGDLLGREGSVLGFLGRFCAEGKYSLYRVTH